MQIKKHHPCILGWWVGSFKSIIFQCLAVADFVAKVFTAKLQANVGVGVV